MAFKYDGKDDSFKDSPNKSFLPDLSIFDISSDSSKKCSDSDCSLCEAQTKSVAAQLMDFKVWRQLYGRDPERFRFDENVVCLFCKDETKIPLMKDNNDLTTEIKKIPFNLLCQEQLKEYEKINDQQLIQQYYAEYFYKELLLKNELINTLNITNKLACPIFSLNQNQNDENKFNNIENNNTFSIDKWFADYFTACLSSDNRIEEINQNLKNVAELKKIRNDNNEKYQIVSENFNKNTLNLSNDAIQVCRQKEPYLKEVNMVIFGDKNENEPKENTLEYFKAAENYALFGLLSPLEIDNKIDIVADLNQSKFNFQNTKIQNEEKRIIEISKTSSSSSASARTSNPDTTNVISTTTKNNIPTSSSSAMINSNLSQLPALDMNQKSLDINNTKKLTIPKSLSSSSTIPNLSHYTIYPQPIGVTPQFLIPSSPNYPYSFGYPNTNYSLPSQPVYFNPSLINETFINTSIIQQQQQQYNIFNSGNYDMFIYEQMLQKTQQITKTVVARNQRIDKKLSINSLNKKEKDDDQKRSIEIDEIFTDPIQTADFTKALMNCEDLLKSNSLKND